MEKLNSEIGYQESDFSLWMFDIDHFKQINDTYGHLVGDEVLVHLGKVINENLRSSDLAGRYGGDKFIVVLPNIDKKEAVESAQWIQTNLKESSIPHNLDLTISGGIATNDEKSDLYELIELVDKRLFEAKKQGRNKIVYE